MKIIFIVIACLFVCAEGPFYYMWHGLTRPTRKPVFIQQVVLNSFGSAIGWAIGYYLVFYRLDPIFSSDSAKASDLIFFFIAFFGMTGYLPYILIQKFNISR